MAHLHPLSDGCTKSELDLFQIPPTQTTIQDGRWIEYRPVANLAESSPVEFDIPSSGEEYVDLSQTQLYVRAKVVRGNGADLPEGVKVGPVNLFMHSLFQQIDVSLNNKLVTPSSNTYPYRAMIETLLNFGQEAKDTQLTTALFYRDTPGAMDVNDPNPEAEGAAVNLGLKKRTQFTQDSNVVDMISPLHVDAFFQERYLINNVDLKIKLQRSKNQFCLMSADANPDYKVVIMEAALFVRKVKLSSSYRLSIENQLARETAKYPLRRVEVKAITLPRGHLTASTDNVFLGQIPRRVVVTLVENTAFQGSYTRNPFNFQHFNLNYIGLNIDGETVPHKALTPSFPQRDFIKSYYTLFGPTEKQGADSGNQIGREDFDRGYAFWCYDLTPDLCGSGQGHFNVVKHGNVRLELHFAEALPETVVALVWAEFENLLEINNKRIVQFDYTN
ncbi:uncharacterized protein F54H12.2-like [Branchiostoma floridae]|uniref:Uncharacterized protein F54H12.2-like n=1 Tax=Branchiostoma floridae TaxID=7739 RepID=A0A9J7M1D3_BRAFL|nr:uncharacterized protein F54H12.2-like [Branchiostoma floridae]